MTRRIRRSSHQGGRTRRRASNPKSHWDHDVAIVASIQRFTPERAAKPAEIRISAMPTTTPRADGRRTSSPSGKLPTRWRGQSRASVSESAPVPALRSRTISAAAMSANRITTRCASTSSPIGRRSARSRAPQAPQKRSAGENALGREVRRLAMRHDHIDAARPQCERPQARCAAPTRPLTSRCPFRRSTSARPDATAPASST